MSSTTNGTSNNPNAHSKKVDRSIDRAGPDGDNNDINNIHDQDPFLLLGTDISNYKREHQYMFCACGIFSFSLLYGYLQELITIQIFSRDMAMFLSTIQFTGYVILVTIMRTIIYPNTTKYSDNSNTVSQEEQSRRANKVPFHLFVSISLLRALELALTNLAMKYVNYPAKTLMKSSRVVFTMLFGAAVQKKKYRPVEYLSVAGMVIGLIIFLHADARSEAVFHYMGVIMLGLSLICDGAIVNISESIMTKYGVQQDEFIFRVYSIALIAVAIAGAAKGELDEGVLWMTESGTYQEYKDNIPEENRTWSASGKMFALIIFSTTGFFALSSCSAITKNFGALTMSVTSTARKAITIFLSFLLFDNVFTMGHLLGIGVFTGALILKLILRHEADQRKQMKRKLSGANLRAAGEQSKQRNGTTTSKGKEKDMLTQRHGGGGGGTTMTAP